MGQSPFFAPVSSTIISTKIDLFFAMPNSTFFWYKKSKWDHHSPVSRSCCGVKLSLASCGPSILREWPFVFILGEGSGSSKFVSRICPTLLDRLLFKVSFPPPLVISWSIREKGKYLIEGILDPVLLAVLKI